MSIETTIKVLSILGGFAGAITLVWRLIDAFKAFLHIEISVEALQGRRVKVRTIVENTNSIARKIDGAFLIVGPENENPDNTIVELLTHTNKLPQFKSLNEMIRIVTLMVKKDPGKIDDVAGRMIIPLPYYYIENVDVADEKLSYEQTIAIDNLPIGTYAVRFYIEAIPRLHRVVQAAFEVTPIPRTR